MIATDFEPVTTAHQCRICDNLIVALNPLALKLITGGKLTQCQDCSTLNKPFWNKANYAEYLKTDQWLTRRRRAIIKALGACQICKSDKFLQVHHNDYTRLGDELDSDLLVVCRRCHRTIHEHILIRGAVNGKQVLD